MIRQKRTHIHTCIHAYQHRLALCVQGFLRLKKCVIRQKRTHIYIHTYIHTQVGALRARLSEAEEMRDKAENQLQEEVGKAKDALALAETRYVYVYMYVCMNECI